MGYSQSPPYVGEIPNTFGHINDPGAFGEMGGGPVRAFGVIWQPFGDVSTGPPCKGVTGIPGFFGCIDQT